MGDEPCKAIYNVRLDMISYNLKVFNLPLKAGNTKGGRITVLLTSCMTGLELGV